MGKDIKAIIKKMTLEEKAGLCSGLDFWHTKPVERLGIPSIMMTDGPVGLRKQAGPEDNLGLNKSVPSTCFPSGSALACSWDRELLEAEGAAIAEEALSEGVSIVLGPAVNIKRSPLCGRNFEYYSEDPYLSSELGTSYVNGVQGKGVGTSVKHFAANNQETKRMTVNEVIDERALHELYLASFENIVKNAQPFTVMCAYNKINGEFCSENKKLLTDTLRDNWGFKGIVISDWGAVNKRECALEAGLELEMPTSQGYGEQKIINAVKSGALDESILDKAVERLLIIIFRAAESKKEDVKYDRRKHHELASDIAKESIVLLKNEDNILPLKKNGKYAVIGSFAVKPRYQGGGSSHINPTFLEVPLDELIKEAPDATFTFSKGYESDADSGTFSQQAFTSISDEPDDALIEEACRNAERADAAILFIGLPENYESEGFDRRHLRIPNGQIKLIEAIGKVQKNVVLVLQNGAAIEMPWIKNAKGMLETYLGGQAAGSAVSKILFGEVNPSGKLAETFPKKLCDTPCYLNFPGDTDKVVYREGVFIGYRYYEAKEVEPLFPFGYGLSYTTFDYLNIAVSKQAITESETVDVTVTLRNTGTRVGKEVIQLYVRDCKSSVRRPVKELKAFTKIFLNPGETKAHVFTLNKSAFAYWDDCVHTWTVETGTFEILVGSSSVYTPLKAELVVNGAKKARNYGRNTPLSDLLYDKEAYELVKKYFPDMLTLPQSLSGSIPVRSFGMFGDYKQMDPFVTEIEKFR